MSDEAELEARMRAVEPGWRFVKDRTLDQARRELGERGIRISESLTLVLSKDDAEAMGCFPSAIFADVDRVALHPPVDLHPLFAEHAADRSDVATVIGEQLA